MIEMIRSWFILIVDGLELIGAQSPGFLLGGIFIGLLLSWGITQKLKRIAAMSRGATEATSFFIAALFCFAIATQGLTIYPAWLESGAAIVVGLFAPLAYKALIAVTGKRWAWVASLRRDDP